MVRWGCVGFAVATLCSSVHAFSFSSSSPSQCDDLSVKWSGGQPPFRLLILPPGGTIRNISIPSSAYQSNQGSFSTQLGIAENQRIILSMSDATGATAGGVTDVMTVGPSMSGTGCNTTDPGTSFFFSLDADLVQCKPYPFTQYAGAILPVSILAIVPLGESFVINTPPSDSFTWTANLTAGTSVSFSMTDAAGRVGGTSSIRVVQSSNDASCITTTATSSSASRTSSFTGSSSPSSTGNSDKSTSKSSSNLGVIIGAAAGGAVVCAIAAFLVYFCFIKRRRNSNEGVHHHKVDLTYDPAGAPAPEGASYLLPGQYTSTPFQHQRQQFTQDPPPTRYFPPNPPVPVAPSNPRYSTYSQPSQGYSHSHSPSTYPLESTYPPDSTYQSEPTYNDPYSQGYYGQQEPAASSTMLSQPIGASRYANDPPAQTQLPVPVATTRPSKKSAVGQATPRVIVHTDIEESDTPVELPPEYSENRAPIHGLAADVGGSSWSANSRTQLIGKMSAAN
ncbi:hypothetical protein BDQ12DRAFT_733544 [Crucibulum laeve]|uniref:Dystroglycan-type cadherin-like domain-containing protein n=1 Tax=Crucibulum laeve TaxID=68775 RepID=A0A5C3M701_9AGAR|nr:hypothetical protein BDQ12DRAFT_733544 [Crucibulum laeve]